MYELPPNKHWHTTYAMEGGRQIHRIADQPFAWFQEHNAAGPFLNAVTNPCDANVFLSCRRLRELLEERGQLHLHCHMYAREAGIVAGSFMRWNYRFKDGEGGGAICISFLQTDQI